MKIAIAGAGIAGAYMYRLLRNEGENEVHVYGHKHTTRCGISPCAWGATKGFNELLKKVGLDPQDYVLQYIDRMMVEGIDVRVDLVTFNKPRLISDLLRDTEVYDSPLDPSSYSRVIDATGTARVFLPPIMNDIILPCTQGRMYSDEPLGSRITIGYIGYAWCFPLSKNSYHVGYGSLNERSSHALSDICRTWSRDSRNICSCNGKIRITAPYYSTPFVDNLVVSPHGDAVPVYGIGEAIGCVGSLAGDGIVPGMRSAEILMQHWEDAQGYEQAILKEFTWIKRERHVLDKITQGDKPGLSDAWVFKNNAHRAGMKIGLREAMMLLIKLGTLNNNTNII